jgi:hypothetical protein
VWYFQGMYWYFLKCLFLDSLVAITENFRTFAVDQFRMTRLRLKVCFRFEIKC